MFLSIFLFFTKIIKPPGIMNIPLWKWYPDLVEPEFFLDLEPELTLDLRVDKTIVGELPIS